MCIRDSPYSLNNESILTNVFQLVDNLKEVKLVTLVEQNETSN